MSNEADNKYFITWVIENFSSLHSEKIYSEPFVISGCRWRILAFPKGNNVANNISLYLDVADFESLPIGWRRHAKFSITIINQKSIILSEGKETQHWFDRKEKDWGFTEMISLSRLNAKDSGFLMNNHLEIVVAVNVLQVIGKLDVLEESVETPQPVKKIKLDDGVQSKVLLKQTSSVKETINVNGFHVLPSQVKTVNHLFEKHPDIATKLHVKNQYLKTGYVNVLLSLVETLSKSPEIIYKEDLADGYDAVESLTNAGFELDWLKKKLDQVEEKKHKVETGEIRMQETEEKLKDLKQKLSDLEAQFEKEKAEVLAARAPLSLSDD